MKHQSKFSQQEQHDAVEQQSQESGARDFASVEEMLRHDAAQTSVPPAIAQRLEKSLRDSPVPQSKGNWWKRMFGEKT